MKPILIALCVILFLNSCYLLNRDIFSRKTSEQATSMETSDEIQVTIIEDLNTNDQREDPGPYLGLSIQEIINLFIEHDKYIYAGDPENADHLGYFGFISHERIQWHRDSGGVTFFPYLYIADDSNIRVEVFRVLTGTTPVLGRRITVGKYYININKEQLIDLYLGNEKFTESYNIIPALEINKYIGDNLFFTIPRNTDVFNNSALQGTRIGVARANTQVEIIDMHFSNFTNRQPDALRIRISNSNGWVRANAIDFAAREERGNANGAWLYNAAREIIGEYGARSVSGVIKATDTAASVPVRESAANNSRELHQLQNGTRVQITEVSANTETIGGIESAWYKIFLYVEHLNEEMERADYEINGWIFGNFLQINEYVDDGFAGYQVR